MKLLLPVVTSLSLLFFASQAPARGFTVSDFGAVATDAICVQRARLMFGRFGAAEVVATTWTVNAYGLGQEGTLDAALVCSYGPDGKTQVSLVLHSWGGDAQDARRKAMPKRLRALWDSM